MVVKTMPALDNKKGLELPAANNALMAVRTQKLCEVVAEQIRRRIIEGDLKEGEFLPSEAVLIKTLGVSRPTLREAFRILEAEQLISLGRGARSGAIVQQPKIEAVARYAGFSLQVEGATMQDVYASRLAIEPFVAHELAVGRSEVAIKRLTEEADGLAQLVGEDRHRDFVVGVARFHQVMVECYGNRTLLLVTRMIQCVVEGHQVRFIASVSRTDEERREIGARGIRSFRHLVKLIQEGDGARAESHWRLHLLNTNKAWLAHGHSNSIVRMFD
jgi:DNA-binding FadR family transcriptional regulator